MTKILNFGSLNIDTVFEVPHIARPGETVGSRKYETFPGGKGANQSVAAARSGAHVFHAGKIGTDGAFWPDLLRAEKIDVSFLVTDSEAPSGRAVIQRDETTGENAIVLFPGANRRIADVEIDRALHAFAPGDILLLQNEINSVSRLISRGAAAGMRVAFNPAPMTPDVRNFDLSGLFLLIVNEHEAHALSGSDDPLRAAELLSVRAPRAEIIVTLGSRGALCLAEGNFYRREAFPVASVADTTGAGDTFAGAYAAMRAEDRNPEESLAFASAAAALSVTRRGAIPSIPVRAETERFLREKQF